RLRQNLLRLATGGYAHRARAGAAPDRHRRPWREPAPAELPGHHRGRRCGGGVAARAPRARGAAGRRPRGVRRRARRGPWPGGGGGGVEAVAVLEAPPLLLYPRAVVYGEAIALVRPSLLDIFNDCTVPALIRAWESPPIRAAISTWDLIEALDLHG